MPLFWFDDTNGSLSWNRLPEQLSDRIALYIVATDSVGGELVLMALQDLEWFQEAKNMYALDAIEERKKLLICTEAMVVESLAGMKEHMNLTKEYVNGGGLTQNDKEAKNSFYGYLPQGTVVMTVSAATKKAMTRLKLNTMMEHYATVKKLCKNLKHRISTCDVIQGYLRKSVLGMQNDEKESALAVTTTSPKAGEANNLVFQGTGSDQRLMDRSNNSLSRLQGVIGFSITRGGLNIRRSLRKECGVDEPPLVTSLHPPPPPAFSIASLYH